MSPTRLPFFLFYSLVVSCGLPAVNSTRPAASQDATESNLIVAGSVEGGSFSLNVPRMAIAQVDQIEMPRESLYHKGALKIYSGEVPVAMPAPILCEVALDSVTDSSEATQDSESLPPPPPPLPPASKPESKGLGLSQTPVRPVVQESFIMDGRRVGPFSLSRGVYTVLLDVYDQDGRRKFFGNSIFKVSNGQITQLRLQMHQLPGSCDLPGGVVIDPVFLEKDTTADEI